jgi:stage II sporulation protein D
LEEYVLGVVAVEASVEDQLEALKAQAVISRTYALKNLGRHAAQGFDLCSNTHCQQFVTGNRTVMREAVRLAVNETAGEVLVDRQGRLVDAYYNASCGGMTSNIETLWGQPAPSYLKGVRDEYCLTGPHSKWTDHIPRERLLKALRSDPRSNVGRFLEGVAITRRDATGRAQRIVLDGEHRRELSGWEFKLIIGRTLGWNLIKSTRFDVSQRGAFFVFRGRGFGHGLGLCQEGAHVMARRGSGYSQILAFYFPQTGIEHVSTNANASRNRTRVRAIDRNFVLVSSSRYGSSVQASVPARSSEHFRVRYPYRTSEVEIEAVLQILEAARTVMLRKLRAASLSLVEQPITVVFHATTQDFTAATGQPWFASGAAGDFKIDMQPISRLRQRRILASTLRHEYAHTAIEALGGNRCPRWLVEGLAIHFAGEAPALMRTRTVNREIPLKQLERMLANPGSQPEMRAAYIAAYREVARRINSQGEATVWRSLRNCANASRVHASDAVLAIA